MEFRILGPLDVQVDGDSLPLGGPKPRALLAILLLNANRVVSRDRLIEELWPDQPAGSADHTLRVQVSRLRKALGVGSNGASPLVTRSPGYVLLTEPGELDLDRFETHVVDGRHAVAAGDPERAAAEFRGAESLWRGRPLADLEFEPFARIAVGRLEELRIAALEERIEAELSLGRQGPLVAELEALVAQHPLRERLCGQLMIALYRCGRQADALKAYRATRTLLVEQQGLDPSPMLKELEQAILRQEDKLGLPQTTQQSVAAQAPPPHAPTGDAEPPAPLPGEASSETSTRRFVWAMFVVALAAVAVWMVLAFSESDERNALTPGNALALVSSRTGHASASASLRAPPTRVAAGLGSLWVTHFDDARISRVDAHRAIVRQTIRVGDGPSGVTVAAGNVWVANTLDGTVSRIDPDTDAVVQTIPVGSQPSALAEAGGSVWVANRGHGTVSRVDASSGRVLAVVSVGQGPSALSAGEHTLWVCNEDDGSVARIDTRTNELVQTIHVGDAPSALAVTKASVWVVDGLDSTLSRVDPARGVVAATIPVGGTPNAVAVMDGGVWVTDQSRGVLSRIDPRRGVITATTPVGERAGPMVVAGQNLWVGVAAGGRRHRGGTLTVLRSAVPSIDPAMLGSMASPLELLGMTNDGLVSLNHVAGPGGARLVPDLALSLPRPSDGGRTYVFRLRPGIRYSTGQLVGPNDVRRSLERLFELHSDGTGFYSGIVGARTCLGQQRCDLSRGIVTNQRDRRIAFHLTAPDPDFLFKLAQPYALVLPASTPSREIRSPLPATGPYRIDGYRPDKEIRLARNPRFREWSSAAQPDGYPDRIVLKLGLSPDRSATLIEGGQADLMPNIGAPPRGHRDLLRTRFANQLRSNWAMGTDFFFLNTRARPFDDVRVRRAVNYALDRNRVVKIYGGTRDAQPTCQLLPPQMPGFRRYCPYTRRERPDGRWRDPDVRRAQRLVTASGTRGMRVKVWGTPAPPIAVEQGRYVAALLRKLGYRASLHLLEDSPFLAYTDDPRNKAQVVSGGWGADYPSPSAIIGRLSCDHYLENGAFCDASIDRQIARAQALQARHPARAGAAWARLDRKLTDRAVWLPTVTGRLTDIVSKRVGNYRYHPFWGVFVDQLWVR